MQMLALGGFETSPSYFPLEIQYFGWMNRSAFAERILFYFMKCERMLGDFKSGPIILDLDECRCLTNIKTVPIW